MNLRSEKSLDQVLREFRKKQILLAFLVLLVCFGSSVIFTRLFMESRAEQTAKLITRMIQIEDFREVGMTLQGARIDYFRSIQFISENPGRSFAFPEIENLVPDSSWWKTISNATVTLGVPMSGGRVVVSYNVFFYAPYAFAIWLLLILVFFLPTYLQKRVMRDYERDVKSRIAIANVEIARKVRHDIRTPLSALMRLSSTMNFRSKGEAELFGAIIEQVRSLISDLDAQVPGAVPDVTSKTGLYDTIQTAVNEIRLTLPPRISFDVDIEDSIPSVLAAFVPHELRAILANLVRNSAEAIEDGGNIRLSVKDLGNSVTICVLDSGCGIQDENLSSVTENGFTYGKIGGTGLGLYHAKTFVESWNGKLKIESVFGTSTTISIQLPIESRESWYLPRIKLKKDSTLVIVDDQIAIHRLWKMKLEEVGFCGPTHYFYNEAGFSEAFSGQNKDGLHFFVDYNLSTVTTGLDFLRNLPEGTCRYLVTGNHDDRKVRMACEEDQIYLISKTDFSGMSIVIS